MSRQVKQHGQEVNGPWPAYHEHANPVDDGYHIGQLRPSMHAYMKTKSARLASRATDRGCGSGVLLRVYLQG